MGKYLNPKADLTFKKIFGEHEDLVMSLLNAYEYYWDAVYNERGAIRHGYKQGMEQGMAQGSRDNAMKMKADGMPTDLIAKYTGLSIDVIDAL